MKNFEKDYIVKEERNDGKKVMVDKITQTDQIGEREVFVEKKPNRQLERKEGNSGGMNARKLVLMKVREEKPIFGMNFQDAFCVKKWNLGKRCKTKFF